MMGFDTGALLPLDKGPAGAGTTHLLLRDEPGCPCPRRWIGSWPGDKLPRFRPLRQRRHGRLACAWRISPLGVPLPVAGKAFAGQPYEGSGPPSTSSRIMTGALCPGCDAVVMQEETEAGDNGIFPDPPVCWPEHPSPRRGSGAGVPRCSKRPSRRLGAAAAPPLASQRHGAPSPQGRHLQHGGRAQASGTCSSGDIYDSNRYGVKAMLSRMGCDCLDLGIIPDDPEALRAALLAGPTARPIP